MLGGVGSGCLWLRSRSLLLYRQCAIRLSRIKRMRSIEGRVAQGYQDVLERLETYWGWSLLLWLWLRSRLLLYRRYTIRACKILSSYTASQGQKPLKKLYMSTLVQMRVDILGVVSVAVAEVLELVAAAQTM